MAREQAEHFWPLKPKAEATTPSTAASRSAVGADDDRVFAAHLEDGALDPDLAGLVLGGALVDFEADGLEPVKAMKRVFGCSTMALPKLAPEPGQKLTTPAGMPASSSTSTNLRGDGGRVAGGLQDDGVAGDDGGRGHAGHDGEGKFHGGMTAPTPSGM